MAITDNVETERKFLVRPDLLETLTEGSSIVQGYFRSEGRASIRVRLTPASGISTLTIKGPRVGFSRVEYEHNLPDEVAQLMFEACGSRTVEKTRHPLAGPDGKMWVIDVFHGANEGLVLAELELQDSRETFTQPDWVTDEVTDDDRYYNEYLADYPYKDWAEFA